MIGGDKKRSAIDAILGPDPSEMKEHEENGDESLHAITEELMTAFHSKDVPAAMGALKAFHAECSAGEGDDSEEG